jgi:AcrR family transcriptional regulator
MGTKKRKEREREARKNDILEAAKTVFFERGFQAATMDQIAEAAELSKGSLYLYFPSKEELYVSILVEGMEILCDRFENAVKGIGAWEEKLGNIAMAYYGFYQGNKNYFKILFLLQHGEIATKVSDSLFQSCFEKGISCINFLSRNGIILLYEEEEHRRFIPDSLDNLISKTIELLTAGLKKR